MTNAAPQPPAGWYPDPAGSDGDRYWDGIAWSQATRDKVTYHPPAGMAEDGHGPQVVSAYQPVPTVAGFGRRVPGLIIDLVIINVVGSMVLRASGIGGRLSGELDIWLDALRRWVSGGGLDPVPMPSEALWSAAIAGALINIACFAIYRTILLGTLGATLGQRVIGVRTVRLGEETATRLGWGTAVVRGVVGALLYQDLIIGFVNAIFAATTRNRQTLSDMISKTQVLSTR